MEAVVTRAALEKAVLAGMEKADAAPMQWGVDDCALWCANIVRDAGMPDFVAKYRGRYKTRRGAMRVLGRGGLLKALREMARRRKWKRIIPANAKPGDVGLAWTQFDDKPVLATVICRDRGWFVGRNERGYTGVPAIGVAVAWSILDDAEKATVPAGYGMALRPPWQAPTYAANHDPLSIFILGALGVTATKTAIAITTFILSLTLSAGISLVASLLQPQAGIGGYSNDLSSTGVPSSQITERQSTPYKRFIFGEAYVGGALFFEQVKAPYLTLGTLVCEGPIEGFRRVDIGTNRLSFSTIAENTVIAPLGVDGQPDYPNRLRVCFRNGKSDQVVDALIVNDYANVGSNFRQQGIASVVARYHFGADQDEFLELWGQVSRPNAYYVVRGAKVYDPRVASHTRPPSRTDYETVEEYESAYAAAQATWSWTRNATLLQTHYLIQDWGGRIPPSRIRWEKIVDSANYDDKIMVTKDGEFIPRHTIDGVVTLNATPYEVLQKLLTANGGRLISANGYVWIDSARGKSPVATIHDKILAGPVKYQSAKEKRDQINRLQIRLPADNRDYQVVDGPILVRSDLEAIDRGPMTGTLSLDYTSDHRRAQRLQHLFLKRSRLGKTIVCAVDVSILGIAADELIGNVVTFDSRLFPVMSRNYLVTGADLSPENISTLTLALTEYDGSIEDSYNAATDEQDFEFEPVDVS